MSVINAIWSWSFFRNCLILGIVGVLCVIVLIWWANKVAVSAGDGKLYEKAADIPVVDGEKRVALVFGCAEMIGNRENLYFKYRIKAAAELWETGAVRGFIVSGDNGQDDYNEPEDMKQALIKRGVPEDKVVCDFAGFRTLDSVVRLKEVFGVTEVVFVTQKFHNERAAYLANREGIDFIGLNARSVTGNAAQKTNIREYLARVKMLLDTLVSKSPKYLGKKEELGF